MPENNSLENLSQKVDQLNKDLEGLSVEFQKADKSEGRVLNVITWVSSTMAIAIAAAIGINFFSIQNEIKIFKSEKEKLISDTNTQISELLGNALPLGADIRNYSGGPNGEIVAGLSIRSSENGKTPIFILSIVIKAKAHIRGEVSGRLIGYEYKFSRNIADALDLLTTDMEFASIDILDTQYLDFRPNGLIMSPMADVPITPNYSITTTSCAKIQAVHDFLKGSTNIGIEIKPVFEAIRNEPASNPFQIKFLSNSVFNCPPEKP